MRKAIGRPTVTPPLCTPNAAPGPCQSRQGNSRGVVMSFDICLRNSYQYGGLTPLVAVGPCVTMEPEHTDRLKINKTARDIHSSRTNLAGIEHSRVRETNSHVVTPVKTNLTDRRNRSFRGLMRVSFTGETSGWTAPDLVSAVHGGVGAYFLSGAAGPRAVHLSRNSFLVFDDVDKRKEFFRSPGGPFGRKMVGRPKVYDRDWIMNCISI